MGASITPEYSSPMSPTVPAGLNTTRHTSTLSRVALFCETVTACDITPAVISHVVIKQISDMRPDSGRKGLVRFGAERRINDRVARAPRSAAGGAPDVRHAWPPDT